MSYLESKKTKIKEVSENGKNRVKPNQKIIETIIIKTKESKWAVFKIITTGIKPMKCYEKMLEGSDKGSG